MSILRADSIRDRAGTGAPDFPNGLTGTLTGNVTGTASTATLANTATVATNAQGLTGTPNITVGTVTGTDATFSGNLTVNGTTTTIDTAVTAVDSLAVDGSVGIGTTNPIADLTITGTNGTNMEFQADLNSGLNRITNFNRSTSAYKDFRIDALSQQFYISGTERVGITSTGTAIFKAGLAEKYTKGTTLAAASNNVALSSGNVHRFTSNESGAQTVNFTGVHATLGDGESVSFTVLVTPAAAGYINAATVDGVAPGGGLKWSGGSAPTAGGTSGRDVYTFTIFKDGTATNSYEIFGAVTNYA